MLKRIVDRIVTSIGAKGDDDAADDAQREAALRMATAVLMIDVARADHVFDDAEEQQVRSLIASHFELGDEATDELFDSASDTADEVIGVHEFTQRLHQHLDEHEKARIVSLLWQVAFADGELDKYENSLVLKISDLLYVSRGRVMRLKHDAAIAAGAS